MIREGYVLIQLIKFELHNYELPIPNGDATTMGEVVRGFMIWETNLLQIACEIVGLNDHVR